ncbi:MAG: nicotinate-nicotinamide nucleotide adenylyltransferase [Deltaproteobacteria bacterium]|nr:nicotinate-nicotinamide nucleotide adenylyltransferase [Deltaproteobacteria bacterium]
MRIGVYGGSFNPPHAGHALVAAWLRWTDRVDEVWLMPAFGHPFDKVNAPFDVRLALCEAVASSVGAWVKVCSVERDLPAPSYTIHTLDHLARAHPAHAFRLGVGADVLPETPKWRAWDRILADYDPIVVGRAGWPTPEGAVDFPGISSTEIRRRAAAGEPIDALVIAATRDRIQAIYGSGPESVT